MKRKPKGSTLYRAQKIRIYPTKEQRQFIEESFGFRRYTFNNAITLWEDMFNIWKSNKEKGISDEDNPYPNRMSVIKVYRKEHNEEWAKHLARQIIDTVFKDLEISYQLVRSHSGTKLFKKPKYKSKKEICQTFRYDIKHSSCFTKDFRYDIENNTFSTTKISNIALGEKVRFNNYDRIISCTFTKKNDKYYISLVFEWFDKSKFNINKQYNSSVGVDMNIGHFDISDKKLSNQRFDVPLQKMIYYEKKASFYQKKMTSIRNHQKRVWTHHTAKYIENKDEKFEFVESKNYLRMKAKYAKYWEKVSNIRKDYLHKLSYFLCSKYKVLSVEDLRVTHIRNFKNLNKKLGQTCFYTFKEMLKYKMELYGGTFVLVDKFFPSTQLCNKCGYRKVGKEKMSLDDRVYHCPKCHNTIDRDLNAACNLRDYGLVKANLNSLNRQKLWWINDYIYEWVSTYSK